MDSELGAYIAIAVIGYLLGSFPTAYVAVKHFQGKDILEYGTGNVGTMNTHRATNSKPLTLLVLAGDVLKGAVALVLGFAIADWLGMDAGVGAAAGSVMAVLGHNYSVFLKFKGGKGLATSAPAVLYFALPLAPVWFGAFFLTVAITRFMVLGQIIATLVLPVVAYLFIPDAAVVLTALAALVIIRHAPRLKNVIQGTEPKLYYKTRSTEKR